MGFHRLSSVLVVVAVAGVGSVAHAKPTGPLRFCETYPDSNLCAVSAPACTLCHIITDPNDPSWNPYGEAVRVDLDDGDFDTMVGASLLAVEDDDSDGDGFTNIEEIEAGTHPGLDTSAPADTSCPDSDEGLLYPVCSYQPAYVFKKVHLDFCGKSPSFEEYEAFKSLGETQAMDELDSVLDSCLQSEFWRGREGELWQMAYPKVRPVRALKAGVDPSPIANIRIADYYNDIILWVWTQIDDNDARDMLLADYFVMQDGLEFTPVDEIGIASGDPCTTDEQCASNEQCYLDEDEGTQTCECLGSCLEAVVPDRRQGLLTTRWVLLYNTMFTAIPRTTAAQAYRAFLGLDIAKQQGLNPIPAEPYDYDNKDVAAEACAVCHSTLDPLTYPFTTYQGFGQFRAQYVADRLSQPMFANEGPEIANTPESGYIFGQAVADLGEWADVAANSDEFAQATVADYWKKLMGQPPNGEQTAEFTALWQGFRDDHGYSTEAMLHDFIKTEAYGAP